MGNISGRILLFVTLAFIVGYLIWYYRVGERRMVYEALACLSGGQRRYLSEKPHYILLNEADKERLIQKKNKRLLKMIILLAAAVSFAALSSWRHGIVLAVLVIGCALYIVLKSRYEGVLSGVVYGVKAVCISATHPVHGRGKYLYTYKLAYYDFKKSVVDGTIMATERGDMSISLSAGAQTTLVMWEKDGKLKVLDWAGWIDVDERESENDRALNRAGGFDSDEWFI